MLISIALALIGLGFYREEHTELVLVGFLFLFLLSLVLINENLEYKSGYTEQTNYTYTGTAINYTTLTHTDVYSNVNVSSNYSHWLGYYLAVISFVGFVGGIIGIKRSKW